MKSKFPWLLPPIEDEAAAMASNPLTRPSHKVLDDENLLTEILLHLPTKSLIKFKSVCRLWCSIISSPSFALIHTRLHPPAIEPTSGILLRKSISSAADSSPHRNRYHFLSLPVGSISPVPLPFSFPAPKILQSCNGLLLFSIFTESRKNYGLYNPTNSRFKVLPSLILGASSGILGVSVAFDPARFEGYKVVCVATTETSAYCYRIFLYSSSVGDSGGSWKEWGNSFSAHYDTGFSNGVYSNGAVHWISQSEDSVYFDVEKEGLGRFPSPPLAPRARGYRSFCEFNGKLHYVDCDEYRSPDCKVFSLLSYGEGWVLKYVVDIPEMMAIQRWTFSVLCVVCGENKEGKRLEMVFHMRRKILAYDLEAKTWRRICELGSWKRGDASPDKLQFGWFDAYPYTPTLALF